MESLKSDRRTFLKAFTGGVLVGAAAIWGACRRSESSSAKPLPERILGKTGRSVTIFGLGGQGALERPDLESEAIRIIEKALQLGVSYIDTAAGYGGDTRCSETYLGKVLPPFRDKVTLATKTHDRTRDGSLRHLEKSLQLLKTDHIDVWQIHNIQHEAQLEKIFARGGAIEALAEAKDKKIVKNVGITGHFGPHVLANAIRRFPFDTALVSLNAADRHYKSFIENFLPEASNRSMGIIGMKVVANRRLIFNWKQLAKLQRPGPLTVKEAMNYTLSLPVSTVVLGCMNANEVEENVQIATAFSQLPEATMRELEARTKPVAEKALYYRYGEA